MPGLDDHASSFRLSGRVAHGAGKGHRDLNYIATELHKSVSPLYRSTTPLDFIKPGKDHLIARYDFVEKTLCHQDYLSGGRYSIADMYLFAISRWLPSLQIDIARWPGLAAHYSRVSRSPAVREALAAEGLARKSAAAD